MTARRPLPPAARGVSLAVLAALRAGRVDLADQADGSTLATSTAPDGTKLMTCTLRMPVRGVDTRTPVLPSVSMVPAPAAETPAPVAVVRGAEVPAQPEPQPTTVRCWISEVQWDDLAVRDEEAHGWVAEPVAGAELGWECAGTWVQAMVPTGAALTELRRVCGRVGVTLHESDTMPPPPPRPEPMRVNGLGPGDLIEMDGARATVGGVDHEGFAWCETNAKGYLTGPVERVLWREVEHLGGNRWRILPVETASPSQKAKRERAATPKRAKAPKTKPARLTPEPEADALTRHGQRCVVAQLHEGSAWELVWCDEMPGQMTHETAWASVVEQAHRARRYDRGGHCAADTRDTPRAEVSRGE